MTFDMQPDFSSFDEIEQLPVKDGRKVVSLALLQRNPFAIQNAFVSLIGMTDYAVLRPEQRFAHLAFRYDSEVQNGGHLQYLINLLIEVGPMNADVRVRETVHALSQVRASIQAEILTFALERWSSRPRSLPIDVEAYVNEALSAEFEDCDSRYYKCIPTTQDRLEAFLYDNEALFIIRVP